jgi:hypothetical protein
VHGPVELHAAARRGLGLDLRLRPARNSVQKWRGRDSSPPEDPRAHKGVQTQRGFHCRYGDRASGSVGEKRLRAGRLESASGRARTIAIARTKAATTRRARRTPADRSFGGARWGSAEAPASTRERARRLPSPPLLRRTRSEHQVPRPPNARIDGTEQASPQRLPRQLRLVLRRRLAHPTGDTRLSRKRRSAEAPTRFVRTHRLRGPAAAGGRQSPYRARGSIASWRVTVSSARGDAGAGGRGGVAGRPRSRC